MTCLIENWDKIRMAKFFLATFLIACIICVGILAIVSTISTSDNTIIIDINNTSTIEYSRLLDLPSNNPVVNLPNPGTYNILVTTSTPSDSITAKWEENVNCVTKDKFGNIKNYEVVYWSGERIDQCTSNKNSNCQMTMTLAKFQKDPACTPSSISVYLSGNGHGDLIITRTG